MTPPGSRRVLRRGVPLAAALLVLAGLAASAGAQTEAGAREARALAERVLRDGAYQTELPAGELPHGRRVRDREGRRPSFSAPRGTRFLAEILIWLLVGAGAVVAVLWLVRTARTAWWEASAPKPVSAAEAPEPRAVRRLPPDLARIEALAAAGRHGEAVHALLIVALARIDRRRGRPFPESATAREVLRAAELPGTAREGLTELVVAVERSLFGRLPLGAEDWARCRAAFGAVEEAA